MDWLIENGVQAEIFDTEGPANEPIEEHLLGWVGVSSTATSVDIMPGGAFI